MTLEDMAMYVSRGGGCLDPAQWDHSWDVLPKSEGNVGRPWPLPTRNHEVSGVGQSQGGWLLA